MTTYTQGDTSTNLYGVDDIIFLKEGAAIDDNGNVYVNVNSTDTIYFAGDTLINNVGSNAYASVLKFDASGVPQWGIGLYGDGGSSDDILDLMINTQQDLIIAGNTGYGGATLEGFSVTVGLHCFAAKINGNGIVQWLKSGPESPYSGSNWLHAITQTPSGEYAATGLHHTMSLVGELYRFGCHSTLLGSRGMMTVLISENPEPSAAFTYANVGLTFTFTDQSTGAWSWDWDFGDGDTSTQQNPVHTYLATGNHVVTLYINDSLCASSGQTSVDTIDVGVNEPFSLLANTFIGTNPFSEYIDVFITSPLAGKVRYEISDVTGKIILEGIAESRSRQRIETAELNNGIYFVTLVLDDYRRTFKAVKVR